MRHLGFDFSSPLALHSDEPDMSCWVVPSVAAEIWGVAVTTVLEKAQLGVVPSKTENGFMFIDVAPTGDNCNPPRGLRGPPPPTFTAVTPVEQPIATIEDWR